MKNIIKKIIITTTLFLLTCISFTSSINASQIIDQYEDEDYKIVQTEKTITILDKKTQEKAIISFSNQNKATLTLPNGEEKSITRDNDGNVYLNNKLTVNSPLVTRENRITSRTAGDGKYHYFQTTYYDTKTQGDLQAIALKLFSLMPYVGWIGEIAGIIQAAKNIGASTLYVKVDHYYITGYSRYKYENYFYSDSKRTKLIKHTTEYKQMW